MAFVAGKSASEKIDFSGLREYLLARMPAYMTPGEWVQVPDIPLTINGKTDIKALVKLRATGALDGMAATYRHRRQQRKFCVHCGLPFFSE